MNKEAKGPYRFDHVGSFLRPPKLLEAREQESRGVISSEDLRDAEDSAIKDIVKLQEDVGLLAITDGEFRRESFHVDFLHKLINVTSNWDFDKAVSLGEKNTAGVEKNMPLIPYINGQIKRPTGGIEVENYKYTSSLTDRQVKVTLPSPTMTHFRGGRDAVDRDTYPDMDDFFYDLAVLYREEISELGMIGCNYIQFDDTNLAYLCDEKMRENARQIGEDPDLLPEIYGKLINDSIVNDFDDMAICIHLCRGNAKSRWFASGGYEPVAETLFNLLNVDGFFLEYDDERSGSFEPLRFVPKGSKKIILGLVTTKTGTLESKDEIKRRIEDASKYVDIEQLCLSPQCGFSSNAIGNLISVDDQKAKLGLIADVVQEIWN